MERIQKLNQIASMYNQLLLKLEDYGMTMQESTEKGMPIAMTRDLLQNIVQTEEELTVISQVLSTISKDWKKEIDFFEAPVEEIERIAREKLERLKQVEEHREEVNPAAERQIGSNAGVDGASYSGGGGGGNGNGRDTSKSRQTTASYSRYSSSAKRDRSLSSHSSVSGSMSANTDFGRGNGRLEHGHRDRDVGNRQQSSRELYHQSSFASTPSTSHKTSISKAGNASAAGIHPSRLGLVTFIDPPSSAVAQTSMAVTAPDVYYNASLDPRQAKQASSSDWVKPVPEKPPRSHNSLQKEAGKVGVLCFKGCGETYMPGHRCQSSRH